MSIHDLDYLINLAYEYYYLKNLKFGKSFVN